MTDDLDPVETREWLDSLDAVLECDGPISGSADGTVTAGSSSQISDGACAAAVMSRARAEQFGARIALHLALELRRRGGGQGDALILHVPA